MVEINCSICGGGCVCVYVCVCACVQQLLLLANHRVSYNSEFGSFFFPFCSSLIRSPPADGSVAAVTESPELLPLKEHFR